MDFLEELTAESKIAYFSMEVGFRNDIPTYSGGLGVLAGDTIKSAADLNLPVVAVSLIYKKGYFRQEIDASGRQIEHPELWNPCRAHVAPPAEGEGLDRGQRDSRAGLGLQHNEPRDEVEGARYSSSTPTYRRTRLRTGR